METKGFRYIGKLLLENMTGQVVKLFDTGEKDVALELALNHTVRVCLRRENF